jgi:NUMOD4 motif
MSEPQQLVEEWIDVSEHFWGHENYECSNTGFIRRKKTKLILKEQNGTNGYYHVGFCKDGIPKQYEIHVIIAWSWIPNPDNLPRIDHINRNKKDNSVTNLRWASCGQSSWNVGKKQKGEYSSKLLGVSKYPEHNIFETRVLINGKRERKYFHCEATAGLWHDEHVLKRDTEFCELNFPALSRLIYAYENNIPVILK